MSSITCASSYLNKCIDDEGIKESKSRLRCMQEQFLRWTNDHGLELKWWHKIFIFCSVSLLVCLLQIFLPPPFGLWQPSNEIEGGCQDGLAHCVCPRETMCATDKTSMALLLLARCSVFFDYPLYMMMFLSKCHNLNNILRRTVLRWWIEFSDMHRIHNVFGVVVGIETMFHSFFHLLRWRLNNDIQLLWQSRTGISGLIAFVSTPLIVWPMALPWLKKKLSFELRKFLHYLSWAWALALVYHAPSRIYWLVGVPASLYIIDWTVGLFLRTHIIEAKFERYGERGTIAHFENPPGFDCSKTSFAYVMCPWISKYQWHAYTLFPYPSALYENHTMLCMGVAGNWTKQLHDKIAAPIIKPVCILGPFQSEFSDCAISTLNAIAVASGIGITPTLSLMQTYAGTKRVNIVWTCRDPGLVEFFIHKVDFLSITQSSFIFIFYTGARELLVPSSLPANLFIFRSRPNLERVVAGIVARIESGDGMPEDMYKNQEEMSAIDFNTRIKIALGRVTTTYTRDEMFCHAVEKTEERKRYDRRISRSSGDVEKGSRPGSLRLRRSSSRSKKSTQRINDEADLISPEGLEAMISEFLGGIGEFSKKDIEDLFSQIDIDGSGFIDRNEFDSFIDIAICGPASEELTEKITNHMSRVSSVESMELFERSKALAMDDSVHSALSIQKRRSSELASKVEETRRFGDDDDLALFKSMSHREDRPLRDWSVFYCGASPAIEQKAKQMRRYGIRVAVEKFDW